jgi:dipeptidyl aminopeptidase/acylaminoacyl peptidase
MLEGGEEHPGPQFRHLTRLGYKLDGHGYIDDAWMHLFVVDLASGRSRRLTSGRCHDGQHAWSPNSRYLAFVSNRIPRADVHIANSDIFVVPAKGGAMRQVTRQRGVKWAPSWSPDGKTIACIGHTEFPDWVHHPGVMTVPARGGRLTELTRHADLYCANEIISDTRDVPEGTAPRPLWSPNGKQLRFVASHDGAANLFEVGVPGGEIVQLSHGKHEIGEVSQNAAGNRWAVLRADATSPGDVWLIEPAGRGKGSTRRSLVPGAATRQLTRVHRDTLGRRRVLRPQPIRVRSRDGHDIHGWVLHARGQKRRAPAVLMVHGGPYGAYGWTFFHEFQMLAAAGYHIVYTNIRGSVSYGEEYMRALVGKWGHVDFRDVTDVADWMETQPWIDAKRIAIAGGSYGGYMTNWAIGHTRRFKCAITQRSVVDIASFYGSSDMGWDFEQEFGGHPWENIERYWRTSPLAFVERIRTPLLILHSDEDHRCPVSQAEELFVALRLLDRDVEMVRFVGESHGLSRSGRPHNRLERLRRIHDWLQRKL